MLKYFAVLTVLAISCSGAPAVDENESLPVHKAADVPSLSQEYKAAILKHFGENAPPQADPNNFEEQNVKFYLYTRERPSRYELVIGDEQKLQRSSYNVKRETKILIHTWQTNENSSKELVSAYLRYHDQDLNVITVDFSAYAYSRLDDFMQVYDKIGHPIAKLVEMLYNYGAHADNMHMLGFGFGAHIGGAAAKYMAPLKLGRLTGLDPIGFLFDVNKTLVQMDYHDADFTDTITTAMGSVGSRQPRAYARFFPNGGMSQPEPTSMSIDHVKAYYYFVESVVTRYGFNATIASSYSNFKAGRTEPYKNYMGEYVTKRAHGNFFLNVNGSPPYGSISYDDAVQPDPAYPYPIVKDQEKIGMAGKYNDYQGQQDVNSQGQPDVQLGRVARRQNQQYLRLRQVRQPEEPIWNKVM